MVIDLQTELTGGTAHELPQSGGSGSRTCQRVHIAFDDHQVLEVIGYTLFL